MKWTLQDNGKVWTARPDGGIGVEFRVGPGEDGKGSTSTVLVGSTGNWPPTRDQFFVVAASHQSAAPDSEEAREAAVHVFYIWATSMIIQAGYPEMVQ